MTKIFTFSECLSLIMQKHQLTLTNLSTLIGSRADLKHVLSEDKSYAKSAKVFEKLKNCNVFDQEAAFRLCLSTCFWITTQTPLFGVAL